ncbi:unnamed protein product [Phyllotreta striolata]|uniref:Peptidase S1 domain-containing protein n=1 Tax=Phyllotreta striolata TaxID=444603 RepID=A0A9N9XS77_PHYSR|nr:unnamed protein product [Phyllotreta striolata]
MDIFTNRNNMKLLSVIFPLILLVVEGLGSYRHDVMSHSHWHFIDRSECGLVKIYPRLAKGEAVKINRFPWMVQVLQRTVTGKNEVSDKFVCSGALINKHYAVTPAHCVAGYEKLTKFIRLGESLRISCIPAFDDCSSRKVKIDSILIHEGYDKVTLANDIALIRLDEELKFNENVRPICLPSDDLLDSKYLGEKVQVAGWGLDSAEITSQILKFVVLPTRDRCVCEQIFNSTLGDNRLCIGIDDMVDTCEGDPGSPVVWTRQENFFTRHYLIGLSSYGDDDCGVMPGVYTNMGKYVKWILDNILGSEFDTIFQFVNHNVVQLDYQPEGESGLSA